jgi:D-glycero-beta-D-manno-heptose 1-phosphate adenylyltransferase
VSHLVKSSSFKEFISASFIAPEKLAEKIGLLREEKKTIATLNGSFDLLHSGHLEMIYQASLQADILIVGLNTDQSIQGYKGPARPIVPLEQRMEMMGALLMVDYVTYFDEPDPRELLKIICPDVHVNGSEYGEDCLEADVVKENGGRVHIVSLVPGLSTSTLIRKIVGVCS